MIIIPDKFVFLATPRTGSRAISEELIRKYPDAITDYPSNHHDPAPDDNDLPVYAVIRNPTEQILSWWAHVDLRSGSGRSVIDFAREYENVMFLPRHAKYRLNIHAEQATDLLRYTEDLAIPNRVLGLDSLEVVGKSNSALTSDGWVELEDFVYHNFQDDYALWDKYNV